MTRSARKRARLATLATSTLSADREEAVKAYKRARKKADFAYAAMVACPHSAAALGLRIASVALAEEAGWDAYSALALEISHYLKPAKKRRFLN